MRPKIPFEEDVRKQRFVDWLTRIPADREPPTQVLLAIELGVNDQTLTQWKRDGEFLAEWEKRYRATSGSPERQQQVLDALHATAIDRTDPRQVPAARAYLEATDAIKPKRVDVTVSRNAKDLSNDELNELLAVEAARELERRASSDT